jgi:hypothetical protein
MTPFLLGSDESRQRVGGAVLSITIPAMRGSTAAQPVDELPKDLLVLGTARRDANPNLGVCATVEETGAVGVGDTVELI